MEPFVSPANSDDEPLNPEDYEPFEWPEGRHVTRAEVDTLNADPLLKKYMHAAITQGWAVVLIDAPTTHRLYRKPGDKIITLRPAAVGVVVGN